MATVVNRGTGSPWSWNADGVRGLPPVGRTGLHGYVELMMREAEPQRADSAADVHQVVDGSQAQRQSHADGVVGAGKDGGRLLTKPNVPGVATAQ